MPGVGDIAQDVEAAESGRGARRFESEEDGGAELSRILVEQILESGLEPVEPPPCCRRSHPRTSSFCAGWGSRAR